MHLRSTPASRHARLFAATLGLGLALAPLAALAAPPTPAHQPVAHKTAPLTGYKTIGAAQGACKGDTVVWHATGSKVFHTSTSKYFGKTKRGAYVCEKAAMAKGLHLGKY